MPAKKTARSNKTEPGHVLALREALATWPGISVHSKFGNASFQVGKKVFAFTRPEGVAMKLPEERIRSVMEQCDADFLVMGPRTMREWMLLRLPQDGRLTRQDLELLREAKKFVAGLKS